MSDPKNTIPYKIVSYLLKEDPFSQWMEVKILEASEGYCKIECPVKEKMLNGFAVTHGGIVFSLADTALAFASSTYGRVSLAVDNSISFMKKTEPGDILTATAQSIQLSYKIGHFNVRVHNKDNSLIAEMKGTVYRTSEEISI
ncbi:MAG: hotdog fold thioesterase [Balneolaceae bacterium]